MNRNNQADSTIHVIHDAFGILAVIISVVSIVLFCGVSKELTVMGRVSGIIVLLILHVVAEYLMDMVEAKQLNDVVGELR